ncbi:MAG: U32 family peptidase, partial [Clostridiales bacterium]|nr:U32 family peptidase [Clostridiales bacterium]
MIRIPELLAPAGGPKQLVAAVENGADAVYLGGILFNARQNAANFNDEELKRGLEYAHVRGVGVYITLNTLINDDEMQEALEYAVHVYEAGADALIVQDIGFAAAVKKLLPDLPLHFSTQTTIYNKEGVRAAERLGAKRVVLARELSLEEIKEIAQRTSLELEMFIHGALCQCYSGQCFLSSMIGGRSGNRGTCAQPCRLPYTITKKTDGLRKAASARGYLLSPKDICTVEHLDKIIASGIGSLKIEGRMKSPEYVAIVTGTYRKYLDRYAETGKPSPIDPGDLKDLEQIYNRGGFTSGYLFTNPGRELITKERAKHWGTYLGKVTGRNERKKYVDIRLAHDLLMGDGIEIVNQGMPGNLVTRMLKNGEKIQDGYAGEIITAGYIEGKVNIGDPVYKISDKALNKRAAETFDGRFRKKIPVEGHLTALPGEPLRLTLTDPDGNVIDATSSFITEPAINRPLQAETAKAQLEKTGDTPFVMRASSFEIGENVSVPLSEINAIRRKAIDDLIEI